MRWNTVSDRELHPLHWVWLWAPAALLLIVVGLAVAGEWIEKQKRRAIGPSNYWRPWIAWYPVSVGEGKTAWLEWVERKTPSRDWIEHRPLIAEQSAKEPRT